jgi:hypothetical protein
MRNVTDETCTETPSTNFENICFFFLKKTVPFKKPRGKKHGTDREAIDENKIQRRKYTNFVTDNYGKECRQKLIIFLNFQANKLH